MDESFVKVVLDTNVIVSGLIYGGKPEQVLYLIQQPQIKALVSPILKAEINEVLIKKFNFTPEKIILTEEFITENFQTIYPTISINKVKDEDDNRVLEAAVEEGCNYIITGDRELLELRSFNDIKIMTVDQFLEDFKQTT